MARPDPAERLFDEYLAASARAGSRIALGQLAARIQPRLLGHARRLTGDAEAARDVVQEAWVEIVRGTPAARRRHRLPGMGVSHRFAPLRALGPRAAARATARRGLRGRTLADRLRRRRRARIGCGPPGARHRALPPDQRAAIALFYLEDLSVAEIAVALDVPVGHSEDTPDARARKASPHIESEGD